MGHWAPTVIFGADSNRAICSAGRRADGFTLVELLTVIGIIALLVGLLMPVLNKAIGAARTVACESNLRQIGMGLLQFENEHRGYMPLAGPLSGTNAVGNFPVPSDIGDPTMQKYTWFDDNQQVIGVAQGMKPISIQAALGPYFGQNFRTDSRTSVLNDIPGGGPAQKLFLCPDDSYEGKDRVSGKGPSMVRFNTWDPGGFPSSYGYSECIFAVKMSGGTDVYQAGGYHYLRVKRTEITGPNMEYTMLLGDCLVSNNNSFSAPWGLTAPADTNPGANADNLAACYFRYFSSIGGDLFDWTRHDKRMNILFADWHVATVAFPRNKPPYLAASGTFTPNSAFMAPGGILGQVPEAMDLYRVKIGNY